MTATQTARRTGRRPVSKTQPSTVPEPTPTPEPTPKPVLAAVPSPSETPKPKTTPALRAQPKPVATVDLGARQVTYWFPKATVEVDGKTVELVCPHARYGHEGEASAKRCIAQLINQHGGRVS